MIFMQGLRGRTGAQLVFYVNKIAGMISRGSQQGQHLDGDEVDPTGVDGCGTECCLFRLLNRRPLLATFGQSDKEGVFARGRLGSLGLLDRLGVCLGFGL